MRARTIVALGIALAAAAVAVLLATREPAPDDGARGTPVASRDADSGPPKPNPVLAAEGASGKTTPATAKTFVLRGSVGVKDRDGAYVEVDATVSIRRMRGLAAEAIPGSPRDVLVVAGLSPAAPEALATVKTDARRQFEFRGLTQGDYAVAATVADGRRAWETVRIEADKNTLLRIDAGANTVDVRAVTPAGAPWRGRVGLVGRLFDSQPFASAILASAQVAETDADGLARFERCAAGAFWPVAFDGDVVAAVGTTFTSPTVVPRVLIVAPAEFVVEGIVVERGSESPIAAASVGVVSGRPDSFVLARTTSGSDGRFRVTAPHGTAITASAPGYAPATTAAPGSGAVRVVLPRAAVVRGRVVADADGAPVAGALVHLSQGTGYSGPDATAVASDADGRFAITDAPEGASWLAVVDDEWVSPLPRTSADADANVCRLVAGETKETELRVVRLGAIAVQVFEADGTPAVGSTVEVQGQVPWGARSFLDEPFATGLSHRSVTTGADGRVVIERCLPGVPHRLTAYLGASTKDGGVRLPDRRSDDELLPTADVEVVAGETRSAELRFQTRRMLRVHVTDPSGAPVANAEVRAAVRLAMTSASGRLFKFTDEKTDASGDARLVVLAGPATLQVTPPEETGLRARRALDVSGDEGEQAIAVRLERGLSIRGRVRWAAGDPGAASGFAGVEVGVSRTASEHAEVSADGTLVITGLEPGRYDVVAWHESERGIAHGGARANAGDADVELVLATTETPDASVVRLVVSPAAEDDDRPLVVRWTPGGAVDRLDRVTHDATPSASPSAGDTIEISYDASTTVYVAVSVGGAGRIVGPLDKTSPKSISVRLGAPVAKIAGHVVDESGRAVEGAHVALYPAIDAAVAPKRPAWDLFTSSATNARGQFSVAGLVEGPQMLTVDPPPGFEPTDPVRIEPGATGLEIRLRRRHRLVVSVVDEDGKPLPRANLWVYGTRAGWPEPAWNGVATDDHGRTTLPASDSVPTRLRAGAPGWWRATEWAGTETRAAPGAKSVTLRVPTPRTLRVRVAGGGPLIEDLHLAIPDDDDSTSTRSAPALAGVVELGPVAPGFDYTLRAGPTPAGDFLWRRGVHAGDDLVLEPQRGSTISGRVESLGGRPRGQVEVEVDPAIRFGWSSELLPDGTFEVRGVPPGSWPVRAILWNAVNRLGPPTTVTGTTGVPLVIRIGADETPPPKR